jgi:hypothetical protein
MIIFPTFLPTTSIIKTSKMHNPFLESLSKKLKQQIWINAVFHFMVQMKEFVIHGDKRMMIVYNLLDIDWK